MAQLSLMFADVSAMGSEQLDEKSLRTSMKPEKLVFEAVLQRTLQLHGLDRGVHAYQPVEFDVGCESQWGHCCSVGLTVHSMLTDFRLRLGSEVCFDRRYQRAAAKAKASPAALPPQGTRFAEALTELSRRRCGSDPRGSRAGGAAEPSADAAPAKDNCPESGAGGNSSNTDDLAAENSAPADASSKIEAATDAVANLQHKYADRLAEALSSLLAFQDSIACLRGRGLSAPGSQPGPPHPTPRREAVAGSPLPSSRDAAAAPKVPAAVALASGAGKPSAQSAETSLRSFIQELSSSSAQSLAAWRHYLGLIQTVPAEVEAFLAAAWERQSMERWSNNVLHQPCPPGDLIEPSNAFRTENSDRAATLRKQRCRAPAPVEEIDALDEEPIMFEQRYSAGPSAAAAAELGGGDAAMAEAPDGKPQPKLLSTPRADRVPENCEQTDRTHIMVLVHGFQGSPRDMGLLVNMLKLRHPDGVYLVSAANEKDTEGDIMKMGVQLANEVKAFVQQWCPGQPGRSLGRLSFLAHSIGGVIVRAALAHLPQYSQNLFTFLSFSSPHLGYLYPPSSLFKTGLWVVRKWKGSKCLEQLSMTDDPDKDLCFMSRLAQEPGLEFFQHIVLASSRQDQYAPFESARIEMTKAAKSDPQSGPTYTKMLRSVLDPIKADRVIRLDIDFLIAEKNLDTAIGRAAHIQFIENVQLMRMLVYSYGFLFE